MPTATRPAKSAGHPSGDNRFKMLDAVMKRHGRAPDALIEVLHKAQELFGHLAVDLLWYVARGLDLPPSKVFGVATFYNFFTLAPKGRHSCVVCLGTACYVKGADAIVEELQGEFNVKLDTARADGELSLGAARCLGSCGMAPVVVVDGRIVGKVEPTAAVELLRQALAGVHPATEAKP